jgi:AmmeMemoRadiSam system protein B
MSAAALPPGVRPPAVAGLFYPADPGALGELCDQLLDAAAGPAGPWPKALVVPHAGLIYSGPIAASAYARVRGASAIARVVLLGPAHRVYVAGVGASGATALQTPLGPVAVDESGLPLEVRSQPRAHAPEHSLEVQLPFLQRVLPQARVTPLLTCDAPPAEVGAVLAALWGGPETLVVISTDLSHYHPYAVAQKLDRDTAAQVLALDETALTPERACGAAGLQGLLWLARQKGLRPVQLDLRSSGDTAGDKARVVGYGAFAFY